MTQTTYYEFDKPEGTDLVNPLVDTNPNWDKLDADLHEFNERSIANCTEVVTLGVHAISRLDTTSKFLKWIATANFTAGETFTVDGLAVAAATPSGATLATGAYVTGSVVLACLNADNTAMTIFVSGTNVATDSERLGGKLPSYYGTAADVADNTTDITNLQNQVGNTSIAGIGDGTCTGAISALNNDLTEIRRLANMKVNYSSLEWESSANSLTHTVANDGELFISIYSPNYANGVTILINNNIVFSGSAVETLPYGGIDHISVSKGDVISITITGTNVFTKCRLYNYKTA